MPHLETPERCQESAEERHTFGSRVRSMRSERGIGLREFARRLGISPTYLSKIERDEMPPPASDKIVAIAQLLDANPDELLASAGKLAIDVREILLRCPAEYAELIRVLRVATRDQIAAITRFLDVTSKCDCVSRRNAR